MSRGFPTVPQMAARHYLGILIPLVVCHLVLVSWFRSRDNQPNAAGSPAQKQAAYRVQRESVDLVLIGDSRTYCGLHPEAIDPLLGTSSVNLAGFAHWLPTQYPAYASLVRDLKPGTTVVWSIGSGNLHSPVNSLVRDAYPIGWTNLPQYLAWGYRWGEVSGNLLYFSGHGWPNRVWQKWDEVARRPIWRGDGSGNQATSLNEELAIRLRREAEELPWAASIEILRAPDSDALTSLAVISRRGAYWRREVDPSFFRAQQRLAAAEIEKFDVDHSDTTPAPAYWRTFLGILDLFKEHRTKLVVNLIPEAPFVYRSSSRERAYRELLRTQARAAVEERGLVWIEADATALTDGDFFDRNHLNSQGIPRYARSVAQVLRPHLSTPANPSPAAESSGPFAPNR